jgi:hypothetical protein
MTSHRSALSLLAIVTALGGFTPAPADAQATPTPAPLVPVTILRPVRVTPFPTKLWISTVYAIGPLYVRAYEFGAGGCPAPPATGAVVVIAAPGDRARPTPSPTPVPAGCTLTAYVIADGADVAHLATFCRDPNSSKEARLQTSSRLYKLNFVKAVSCIPVVSRVTELGTTSSSQQIKIGFASISP